MDDESVGDGDGGWELMGLDEKGDGGIGGGAHPGTVKLGYPVVAA